MGLLKGRRVYLSGPIEFSCDKHNWRTDPSKVLSEEFGMDVFDPFNDPKQQWAPLLRTARENKDFETMAKIASDFVSKDLTMVSRSDMLIAYTPYRVPTTGTVHEVIHAHADKKPTLLVCPEGKEFCPLWYYGFVDWKDAMFGSWEELYAFLRDVEAGKHNDKKRWRFINNLL